MRMACEYGPRLSRAHAFLAFHGPFKKNATQSSGKKKNPWKLAWNDGISYVSHIKTFIFQLREYPCNIAHDIYLLIYHGYF